MTRRNIRQLNAIGYAKTAKSQKEAIKWLADKGINYDEYCKMFAYNGSPCMLRNSVYAEAKKTMENVKKYISAHPAEVIMH